MKYRSRDVTRQMCHFNLEDRKFIYLIIKFLHENDVLNSDIEAKKVI